MRHKAKCREGVQNLFNRNTKIEVLFVQYLEIFLDVSKRLRSLFKCAIQQNRGRLFVA